MGRIKTISVKTIGDQLLKEHREEFTDNFDKNKEVLATMKKIESKKIRNVLAGYITKEIRKAGKEGA